MPFKICPTLSSKHYRLWIALRNLKAQTRIIDILKKTPGKQIWTPTNVIWSGFRLTDRSFETILLSRPESPKKRAKE